MSVLFMHGNESNQLNSGERAWNLVVVFFAVSKIRKKKMRTIFEEILKPECL